MKSKKLCYHCGEIKSLNRFYISNKGFGSVLCKKCTQEKDALLRALKRFDNVGYKVPDLPGEIWKDVVGSEKYYRVSNKGRVKTKGKYSKLLKGYLGKDGYLSLAIRGKTTKIHRLVAMAFIPNPKKKPHINHLNNIRFDNNKNNLEWVTMSENMIHAAKQGRLGVKGSKHCRALANIKDINKMYELRKTNMTYVNIAKKLGFNTQLVYFVLKRISWKHLKQDSSGIWYES